MSEITIKIAAVVAGTMSHDELVGYLVNHTYAAPERMRRDPTQNAFENEQRVDEASIYTDESFDEVMRAVAQQKISRDMLIEISGKLRIRAQGSGWSRTAFWLPSPPRRLSLMRLSCLLAGERHAFEP